MSAYSLFSLTALLLKAALAVKLLIQKKQINVSLVFLLIFLSMLNILEFMALSDIYYDEFMMRLFYAALVLVLAQILVTINAIMGKKLHFPLTLLYLSTVISAVILVTDFIIAGSKVGGIGYTAIRGEYYFLFQGYALTCLLTAGIYIVSAVRQVFNENVASIARAKASIIILSLMPFVIGVSTVIILMAFGLNVNAAVLIPITTTIFLFGCYYAIANTQIIDYSIFVPRSPSWKAKKDVMYFFYTMPDNSEIKERLIGLERAYIDEALIESDNNLTKAAEKLGYTPGKLHYRIKEIHKIEKS